MATKKKPSALILSDLWGTDDADYLDHYRNALHEHGYKVKVEDSRLLAGISPQIYKEKALHHEFVHGGIERAVDKLVRDRHQYDALIGMSIGGTIGWRAILNGLKARCFIGISATRLRFETQVPDCAVRLYYASGDKFKPPDEWKECLGLVFINYEGNHLIYHERLLARLVCKRISLDNLNQSIVDNG